MRGRETENQQTRQIGSIGGENIEEENNLRE